MSKNGNGNNPNQAVFEEIMLREPPPLRIWHARISIEAIDFDPDNPRLRYLKAMHPDKTDTELLFLHPDTAWLKKDIKDKGVVDPIYVKKIGDRYLSVEGNRRVAVVTELHREDIENPRFFTIPARVLPEHTTEEQSALLMASFHVAGKVKWDAHEKAGHIYHMLKILHIPEAELANTLHMAVPTIKRTAESYAILQEVYRRIDGGIYDKDADGKWSFFAEMLKIKEFRQKHEQDQAWAAQFSRWVGEGRLPKAENVRELPAILVKAKSRHLFENEPSEEAFDKARIEANKSRPEKNSRFFKTLKILLKECETATFKDIDLADENDAARVLLTDAYQQLGSFMEKAGVKLPPPVRRVA